MECRSVGPPFYSAQTQSSSLNRLALRCHLAQDPRHDVGKGLLLRWFSSSLDKGRESDIRGLQEVQTLQSEVGELSAIVYERK